MAEKVPGERPATPPPDDRSAPVTESDHAELRSPADQGRCSETDTNLKTRNEAANRHRKTENDVNKKQMNCNDFGDVNARSDNGSITMNRFRASAGATSPTGGNSISSVEAKNPGEAFEAVLDQLGHFGFYQRYVLILICIPNILAAMYSLNYVFVADQVPFRCVVPECEGSYNVQFANGSAEALQSPDACRRYEPLRPDQLSCERDHYLNDTIECEAFVYESMDTIYAEFGLACREWLRTLVGTVRNAALPLALLLTGYLSDGWGRRTAFCVFAACAGTLGLVKSFSVNYQMYLAVEFFEAALGYGFNSAAYVMMVELARPSLRAAFACATGVAYGLGGVLLALVAARARYWRSLLRAVYTPALLLPLYWLLLDESARWLHAAGRADRAVAVVRKAAAWNKVTLSEDLIQVLNEEPEGEVTKSKNRWLDLVKSRVMLWRFALCSWCWISAAFVYYGLTINSVTLAGDKYVNFALNMAMEIVASLLLMMALERFGRKRSIFAAFTVCGVACVIPYFITNDGANLGLFFVGKLSITFAFNSLYVFTAELFPTAARSSALGAVSLVGRLGSVLAPQTPLLAVYVQALLYGGCSMSAALAVLLAPETRRESLPAHVLDAERLASASPARAAAPAPAPAAPRSAPAEGPRAVTIL